MKSIERYSNRELRVMDESVHVFNENAKNSTVAKNIDALMLIILSPHAWLLHCYTCGETYSDSEIDKLSQVEDVKCVSMHRQHLFLKRKQLVLKFGQICNYIDSLNCWCVGM